MFAINAGIDTTINNAYDPPPIMQTLANVGGKKIAEKVECQCRMVYLMMAIKGRNML
jgi:hypothetical protein